MFYRHNNITLQFIYIHVVLFCVPRHSLLPANNPLLSPPSPRPPELLLHGNVKTKKGKREREKKKEEKGECKTGKGGKGKIRKRGKVGRGREENRMGAKLKRGKGDYKKTRESEEG